MDRHAVEDKYVRLGSKNMYVSMGQSTCHSAREFSHEDIPAKVVAVGKGSGHGYDYAIAKINEIKDIKPAVMSPFSLTYSRTVIAVGFPGKYTLSTPTGFRYPWATFMKPAELILDGTMMMTISSPGPGSSGSGVFTLAKNGQGQPVARLSAIVTGAE